MTDSITDQDVSCMSKGDRPALGDSVTYFSKLPPWLEHESLLRVQDSCDDDAFECYHFEAKPPEGPSFRVIYASAHLNVDGPIGRAKAMILEDVRIAVVFLDA